MSTSKAILVGRSAARVFGIPVIGAGHDVELNLPSRHSRRPRHDWPPKFHYRARVLRPIDLDTFNGLRVTNVYRTVIDIARLHGLVEGIVAFDAPARVGEGDPRKSREGTRVDEAGTGDPHRAPGL
ncbi:MAG: hypothetical protein Q4G50_04020 [Corynebacterium sp.]|uniref:hypothetical protein n=1 Tax=Corynebacterium sp. TaxID=1720 RepID=UPI0026E05CD7|nr:hypothetical protein [Corynebacterium sp.]MDO5669149.1 hypothetical protein [Corynebacterium sp.]